jgi:glycerol-3-phosphate acyltransferase PlsY
MALVGFAAFLGHLWPVFFKFKGGKGVATAAGVLFGLNPFLGLATLATWIIIVAFSRYSSLASIVAAAFAPFYQLLIWGGGPTAVVVMLMGGLLVWRHRANIKKLLNGTESKVGRQSPALGQQPLARPHERGHGNKHAHDPLHKHKHSHKHGAKS